MKNGGARRLRRPLDTSEVSVVRGPEPCRRSKWSGLRWCQWRGGTLWLKTGEGGGGVRRRALVSRCPRQGGGGGCRTSSLLETSEGGGVGGAEPSRCPQQVTVVVESAELPRCSKRIKEVVVDGAELPRCSK